MEEREGRMWGLKGIEGWRVRDKRSGVFGMDGWGFTALKKGPLAGICMCDAWPSVRKLDGPICVPSKPGIRLSDYSPLNRTV
ncbi:uncharacterized protein DS421_12g361860 [Arachis hypogaea]|nr:uncharacterized protein DS421_12g361860 [Arachis hypogaea]